MIIHYCTEQDNMRERQTKGGWGTEINKIPSTSSMSQQNKNQSAHFAKNSTKTYETYVNILNIPKYITMKQILPNK